MSLSPEIAAIVREETRTAFGTEVSPATIARDILVVLASLPAHEARVFAARLSDAAMEYIEKTDPGLNPSQHEEPSAGIHVAPPPTEPGPAAPSAPVPDPGTETAPADAVADTPPAEEPSADAA